MQANNPVAAALLSSMGYNESERVQLKVEFLRMLLAMELNPARMQLLAVFFDSYLKLSIHEEGLVREQLNKLPKEALKMEMLTSWEKIAMKKGKKEGKKEGKIEGKKEGKLEVARNLLVLGTDVEVIVQATGLTEEEIARVKR